MSASDTRNACIDELHDWLIVKQALPLAPTYSASNPNRYRAGAAVGLMLAGKMCLWEERWTDAIEILGYLEDNLSEFGLKTAQGRLFCRKTTRPRYKDNEVFFIARWTIQF